MDATSAKLGFQVNVIRLRLRTQAMRHEGLRPKTWSSYLPASGAELPRYGRRCTGDKERAAGPWNGPFGCGTWML